MEKCFSLNQIMTELTQGSVAVERKSLFKFSVADVKRNHKIIISN